MNYEDQTAGGPSPEELRRVYEHFAAMPVGDRNCKECGGTGFANYGDTVGRCGCMPPFMVQDPVTGAVRYGSLLIDGRLDGATVNQREAEDRHQEGIRIAEEVRDKAIQRARARMHPRSDGAAPGAAGFGVAEDA
jgi:hypothetical protein